MKGHPIFHPTAPAFDEQASHEGSASDYEVEIRQIFEMEDFAPILSDEQIEHKVKLRAELPNQTANR